MPKMCFGENNKNPKSLRISAFKKNGFNILNFKVYLYCIIQNSLLGRGNYRELFAQVSVKLNGQIPVQSASFECLELLCSVNNVFN